MDTIINTGRRRWHWGMGHLDVFRQLHRGRKQRRDDRLVIVAEVGHKLPFGGCSRCGDSPDASLASVCRFLHSFCACLAASAFCLSAFNAISTLASSSSRASRSHCSCMNSGYRSQMGR
ncbi:hypothetical protein M404DRAFT_999080 [Pisolithus tinctorius Marx 270]|uniref:Uncharacterized protein n=1 Tax=Pisolithus tinctorius Marx 270 TaxID=870435 RepID=A0A0C3JBG5_PISTI|nr:hypothetical protein M404DRAFT_999080 [Pisolithus tinctorius Marx 270]